MKVIISRSVSFIRLGIVFLSVFIFLFLAHTLVQMSVKNRLLEFDRECTFGGIEYGLNAVIIRDLHMPGSGFSATEASVLMEGSFFHPVPSWVVLQGVIFQPVSFGDSHEPFSSSSQLPAISVLDGFIPEYGTRFYGTRIDGFDVGYATGQWGTVFVNHYRDSISVVFNHCSSIPGLEEDIPSMVRGRSISGRCTGVLGLSPAISGEITELDGKPASALFEYHLSGGIPDASFSMDFSQIADQSMALLDSLSSGAILSAVPSGSLSVGISESDTIFFSTDLRFDSMFVWSPYVAPDTFLTEAAFLCSGFIIRESGLICIESGTFSTYQLALNFDLTYSWGERRKLDLVVSNPSISGGAITASIPHALLGRLSGLTLDGELSVFTELTLDWDYPDSSDIHMDIDASELTVGYSPITFGRIRDHGGAECLMRDSWGNTVLVGLDMLTNPDFVFFDSLPFSFEPLLRCAEDATFRRHNGFSEYHVRNSIRANMVRGSFVRGGSTISMQLAKNLFLGREKTLSRKLQEVFLTWRLERWLSKDRILEIYANIVEMGPGVFGFDSAAKYYFNERVADISVREMAFLVSILPGPKLYHRYAVQGALPSHWESYIERLITICGNRGWLEMSVVSEALADTLIFDGAVSRP
ncbi:MAG: transglycosylase domain-containing protein [Candidatus Sabulitectum sp.]|nr:transglycosylase domain-containing protein [Candidatus Sabulitectum sp.]